MYVTVTKTKAQSDQPLEVSTIVGEEMTSWLRQIDGFEGLLLLSNEAGTVNLALTFWRTGRWLSTTESLGRGSASA